LGGFGFFVWGLLRRYASLRGEAEAIQEKNMDCRAAIAARNDEYGARTGWGFSLDCFTALQFAMTGKLDCRAATRLAMT
jgi:hypothetical protein